MTPHVISSEREKSRRITLAFLVCLPANEHKSQIISRQPIHARVDSLRVAGSIWRAPTSVPSFPRLPLLPAIIGAALLAAVYLAFTTGSYVLHYYQLRNEERELKTEIAQLAAEQEQLNAVRDYLQSDEYVEDVARRTLGLVRPGETLVIVSGTSPTPAPTPDAAASTPIPGDDDWWKALFVPPAAPTPTPPP
jgi:cell division protein FtsB